MKHYLNTHGNEIRSFYELMNPHMERLRNETQKFIDAKKVIKIAMQLRYTAIQYEFNHENGNHIIGEKNK